MVTDPVRSKIVLFGGWPEPMVSRETWEWDGAAATWANRTPDPIPVVWVPPRVQFGFAFDSSRGAAVMFGGGVQQDIWEWNGDY
jgi:hypothetical protein